MIDSSEVSDGQVNPAANHVDVPLDEGLPDVQRGPLEWGGSNTHHFGCPRVASEVSRCSPQW